MNIKIAIICGLLATIAFVITGGIVSQLLFFLFPYLGSGILGQMSQVQMISTSIIMGIIEGISFAIIFDLIYVCLPFEGA